MDIGIGVIFAGYSTSAMSACSERAMHLDKSTVRL